MHPDVQQGHHGSLPPRGCRHTGRGDALNKHQFGSSVAIADPSLAYDAAGIGLFFAALHRVDGQEATLGQFEAVLASLRDFAEPRPRADFHRPLNAKIGMAGGYGGLVYALTAMARITKREDLVDLAARYAMVVTPEAIAAETELNIHSGLAGAALGMAALYRQRPEPAVAERLRLCGERLLVNAPASALSAMKPRGLLGGPAEGALAAVKLANGIALAGTDALVERALELETDISPGGWCEGGAGVALVRMIAAEAGLSAPPDLAMLGVSASQAAKGMPLASIMVFPLLFAAGMSLVDTTDGVLMLGAYDWAFVKPIRKLYYNMTITLVSVVVAVLIGGIEALGLVSEKLALTGGARDVIGVLNDNFNNLGFLIIGVFLAAWCLSYVIYKVKRLDDLEPSAT